MAGISGFYDRPVGSLSVLIVAIYPGFVSRPQIRVIYTNLANTLNYMTAGEFVVYSGVTAEPASVPSREA